MNEKTPVNIEKELIKTFEYGSLYQNANGAFIVRSAKHGEQGYKDLMPSQYVDDTYPLEGMVERLHYRMLPPQGGSMQDIQTVMALGVHPDEQGVIDVTRDLLTKEDFSRTELYNPNILAELTGTRGMHRPATQDELDNWDLINEGPYHGNKATMLNMVLVPDDPTDEVGNKGIYVDLNRGFEQAGNPITWSDIKNFTDTYKFLGTQEAVLLAEGLRMNPQAKLLITCHEDFERGGEDKGGLEPGVRSESDGVYIYYCVANRLSDPHRQRYYELHNATMEALLKNGFDVYEGVDDPDLDLRAKNGLIDQSLQKENGDWEKDSSFEGFAVRSGAAELTTILAALTIEIPGLLSMERKRQAMEIILQFLVKPLIKEYTTLS